MYFTVWFFYNIFFPVVQYPDKESAVQAVEDGNAWGVIHFEENFSENLYKVNTYVGTLGHCFQIKCYQLNDSASMYPPTRQNFTFDFI